MTPTAPRQHAKWTERATTALAIIILAYLFGPTFAL